MDKPKKCSKQEAIKMLFKGAYVFIDDRKGVYKEETGCRKCNEIKKGNFCSNCGSKLTSKLKVRVGTDVTQFRIQLVNGELRQEIRKNGDEFYHSKKRCTLSLNYFLNCKHLSWIW